MKYQTRTIRGLKFDQEYVFRVRAKSGDRVSQWSKPLIVIAGSELEPSPPATVTISTVLVEKAVGSRYDAEVEWSEVTTYQTGGDPVPAEHIDRYIIELYVGDSPDPVEKYDRKTYHYDDNDTTLKVRFRNIQKGNAGDANYFTARVRAVDRSGKRGQWKWADTGAWTSDPEPDPGGGITLPGPVPTITVADDNFYALKNAQKGHVNVNWDVPDGWDSYIKYYRVELATDSGFTDLLRKDPQVLTTNKVFNVDNLNQLLYVRVKVVAITDEAGDWSATLTVADPSFISETNLKLWLINERIAIKFDEGEKITKWPDASGNEKNFVEVTSGEDPRMRFAGAGGAPSARFTGGDQLYINDTGALQYESGHTLFMVINPSSDASSIERGLYSKGAWGDATSLYLYYLGYSGGNTYFTARDKDGDIAQVSTKAIQTGTTYLLWSTFTTGSPSGTMALNVKDSSSTASGSSSVFDVASGGHKPRIGVVWGGSNNRYFAGDISEVILYNTVLSADDTTAIVDYLSNKYHI